jgi:hypothetical protein
MGVVGCVLHCGSAYCGCLEVQIIAGLWLS